MQMKKGKDEKKGQIVGEGARAPLLTKDPPRILFPW